MDRLHEHMSQREADASGGRITGFDPASTDALHAVPDPDTYLNRDFGAEHDQAAATEVNIMRINNDPAVDNHGDDPLTGNIPVDEDHKHHHHHHLHQPTHEEIAVAAYYIWLREAAEPIVDLNDPALAVSNWLEAEQDLIADHELDEETWENQ